MLRSYLWATVLLASALAMALPAGCATDSGRRRGDRYDDDDDDGRRRRRRKPRVLIKARRLPDAVIERSRTGRARNDLDRLRETFCDRRVGAQVVFYQLVVSRHWHYYWLCSTTKVKRAATRRGARKLATWLRRVKRRARMEAGDCSAGSARKLFSQRHESGVRVKAYCDGVLILRYPDRGKTTLSFRAGASDPAPSAGASCPRCPTCPSSSGARCPVCPARRACPPQRRCPPQRVCPPPRRCPKQKQCPAPNTKATCKRFGENAFWLGVSKACKRICTAIYKRCRKINPKTAMCYQLSEYCMGMKGVCKR